MANSPPKAPPPSGPSWQDDGDAAVVTKSEKKVKRPELYNVILHNDNYTTMEFVVMVLMSVFNKTEEQAVSVMLHVHEKGAGTAGTYSYEIAETKASKVMKLARDSEFPLRCTVEPA